MFTYVDGLLKYKDASGQWHEADVIKGESAYQAAVRLGLFSGTETEYYNKITNDRDSALGQINTKLTEVLSAIDTKKQQTLADIPDDYTALSGDVSDLKSAIDELDVTTGTIEKAMPSSFFENEDITDTITYTNQQCDYEGNISDSNVRLLSSYIPLGKNIAIHNSDASTETGIRYWIRVFNAEKEFIANARFTAENTCGVGTGSVYGVTAIEDVNLDNIIPKNENAKYVRLVLRFMATTSTPISPSDSTLTFDGDVLIGGSLEDVFLSNGVKPDNTSFFDLSTNIFDGNLVTGRLTSTGTLDDTQTTYKTTEYIDIHGNTEKYIMAESTSGSITFWGYAFYTKDKIFISGNDSSNSVARQIPNGAYYARLSIVAGNNKSPFIGINDTSDAMPYEPYYQILKGENLPSPDRNWYKGKKISALGDSITANGNDLGVESSHSAWRQFVYELLLLASPVVNNGIGGTRVSGNGENAMWQDSRVNAIATDSDVVLFNGGMNDWGGNAPLGTEDSVDTDTFMGALNVLAVKLVTRFPDKRIFWMTTTYGRNNNDDTPDVNTLNLTTWDYAEAIRTIAKKYGFPVIDLAAECGWNKVNYAGYLNAENGVYIHPNRNGGKRIAEVIVGRLAQFQPVTMT